MVNYTFNFSIVVLFASFVTEIAHASGGGRQYDRPYITNAETGALKVFPINQSMGHCLPHIGCFAMYQHKTYSAQDILEEVASAAKSLGYNYDWKQYAGKVTGLRHASKGGDIIFGETGTFKWDSFFALFVTAYPGEKNLRGIHVSLSRKYNCSKNDAAYIPIYKKKDGSRIGELYFDEQEYINFFTNGHFVLNEISIAVGGGNLVGKVHINSPDSENIVEENQCYSHHFAYALYVDR
ncbi:hypothetical protein Ddc_14113 [Ditylenchus destructor]|nr:hypothetical protein Ddc_14113 [Ditylenchus destructor]